MTKRKPQKTRCAIYTRKSSEERLEQEFNSLDAQREACESYIQSQKHEGWIALPDLYDDGGFSSGSMKRPALERLLEEIRAKNIDVIVVYKIDRLTRSLADFAKMVELFDERGVSFVSVTQIPPATQTNDLITLSIKAELKRCGMEMKMVVSDGTALTQAGPDHTLVTTIIKAHSWWNKLTSGEVKSIRELAEQTGSNERYVSKILKLNFLAPEMIETIMAGKQPAELTADTLIKAQNVSMRWDEQLRQFGFHQQG